MESQSLHIEEAMVPTWNAGVDKRIRFSALLGMMQDAAYHHAGLLGVGYEQLLKIDRTWVLSRFELQACSPLPCWGETIRIETWPRKLDRMQAYRDFRISLRGSAEPFLKASSSWFLVDTNTRRPAKPHEAFQRMRIRPVEAIGPDSPFRVGSLITPAEVCVRRAYCSDLDPNGHVNNTRYFDWIVDALSLHLGRFPSVSSISIHIQKEIQLLGEVHIRVESSTEYTFHVDGISASGVHFVSKVEIDRS